MKQSLDYYLNNCTRIVQKSIFDLVNNFKTFDDKNFVVELDFSNFNYNHYFNFKIIGKELKSKVNKIVFKSQNNYQCDLNNISNIFNRQNKLFVEKSLKIFLYGPKEIMKLLIDDYYLNYECTYDCRLIYKDCKIFDKNLMLNKNLWIQEDDFINKNSNNKASKIYIKFNSNINIGHINSAELRIYDLFNNKYVDDLSKFIEYIFCYDKNFSLINVFHEELQNVKMIKIVNTLLFGFDFYYNRTGKCFIELSIDDK